MISGKVWGRTERLFGTGLVEVHRLKVKPNSRCSMHMHAMKWNAFVVIAGEICVEVEKRDYRLTDVTKLAAGDVCLVKPGEYHRFVTGARGADVLEIYYAAELSEDIVRRDVGKSAPSGKKVRGAR